MLRHVPVARGSPAPGRWRLAGSRRSSRRRGTARRRRPVADCSPWRGSRPADRRQCGICSNGTQSVSQPASVGPARQRQRSPALAPPRRFAEQLPADLARHVGVDDVLRHAPASRQRLAELVETARAVQIEQAAHRQRIEPHRPQRQRLGNAVERRTDDRAARRDQHALRDAGAALDGNDLVAHLAGHEAVALPHAAAVGADLLDKQIGIVDQARRQSPGAEAVVAGQHVRAAEKSRAGGLPFRRADVGEIPVARQTRIEVRIVGDERPARGGAARGDGPVVRAAAAAHQSRERGDILREPIEHRPGGLQRRRRGRQPVGIGRIERRQRFGAVVGQDAQPRQFDVPVRRQRERDQLHDAEAVERRPRRRLGAQERELVRPCAANRACGPR